MGARAGGGRVPPPGWRRLNRPVEVKSGSRTRARSLRSYIARYEPRRAVKLVGGPGGDGDGPLETWPLYYAQHLRDL